MTINESITPLSFPARSFIGTGAVQGANMAFRRKVLVDIGGFDPLLGAGSMIGAAEDLDAAGRASAIGWKGMYAPEVIVRHHHGRKKSDVPRLMKSYGIGAGAYHMKLLLEGHELLWFVRSVYQMRRRYKFSRRAFLWEPVGGEICIFASSQCTAPMVLKNLGLTTAEARSGMAVDRFYRGERPQCSECVRSRRRLGGDHWILKYR